MSFVVGFHAHMLQMATLIFCPPEPGQQAVKDFIDRSLVGCFGLPLDYFVGYFEHIAVALILFSFFAGPFHESVFPSWSRAAAPEIFILGLTIN